MTTNAKIRLASYNIRKCVGLDRRRRPMRIIDILNSLGADVIALQEADRRFAPRPAALPARLIEDETDFRAVELDDSGTSVGWHGNAVLVRKNTDFSDARTIELPGTEPRGALCITISGGTRIVATHLGLMRRDRRRQQRAILSAVNGAAARTVILGDFNEWSLKHGLEPLSEVYAIHSPGRSFHAARPVAALDRLALGADLTLTDAGVFETRQARIASDHLPIWADIRPIS